MKTWSEIEAAYLEELVKAHRTDYYVWPVDRAPVIAAKVVEAFRSGSYNKDGAAVKALAKRLDVPVTYKALNQVFARLT